MRLEELIKDKELAKQYSEQGYVTVPLLTAEEVAATMAVFNSLKNSAPQQQGFYASIWSDNAGYRKGVDAGVKQILHPAVLRHFNDVRAVFGNFMVKISGSSNSLHPHQDWSFVEEPEFDSATVWCPLTDVSSANGNLQVVPGSHHINNFVRARFADQPFKEQAELVKKTLVDIPLKAGEAIILNSRLIHASPDNTSATDRVSASIAIAPQQAPLYHWVLDKSGPEYKNRKLAVSPDFFWSHSCFETLDGLTTETVVAYKEETLTAHQLEAFFTQSAGSK